MLKKVVKRDGKVVPFDIEKITNAIKKAGAATEEFKEERAKRLAEKVVSEFEKLDQKKTPSVEQIQDIVEKVLMESSYKKTAKAYISYRNERTVRRMAQTSLMDAYRTIAVLDAKQNSDIKRSNANVDGNSAMGKMLQFGAEGAKFFAKSVLMEPRFGAAHDRGDIHIHDLDFYATGTLTCC